MVSCAVEQVPERGRGCSGDIQCFCRGLGLLLTLLGRPGSRSVKYRTQGSRRRGVGPERRGRQSGVSSVTKTAFSFVS